MSNTDKKPFNPLWLVVIGVIGLVLAFTFNLPNSEQSESSALFVTGVRVVALAVGLILVILGIYRSHRSKAGENKHLFNEVKPLSLTTKIIYTIILLIPLRFGILGILIGGAAIFWVWRQPTKKKNV